MKNPSLSTLNKKLWKIFSEYIRRKEADENGFVICFSCGAVKTYTEVHAGHYIPKSISLKLRFDERNVHNQCVGCNLYRHGNLTQYAIALQKKYGPTILEELDALRHEPVKYSRSDYEEMIDAYKKKLKDLDGHIIGGR